VSRLLRLRLPIIPPFFIPPFAGYPPCRDRNRDGDDQKARQMMGADINRIEVKGERQHHHGVLSAWRKGDHDIGDRERK